jgi:hypothetical protein
MLICNFNSGFTIHPAVIESKKNWYFFIMMVNML